MTFHHHHRMNGYECCEGEDNIWGAFVIGLGLFVPGVILMLDNFSVIDASGLVPYWPVFLIVVGISYLVGPASTRRMGWGLSWIAVGAIILLNTLGVIALGIKVLWPVILVILVILGINLLLRETRWRNHEIRHRARAESSDSMDREGATK